MKKTIVSLFCALTVSNVALAEGNNVRVFINNEELMEPTVIINNRTYVPMIPFFERIGFDIEWEEENHGSGTAVYQADPRIMFGFGLGIDYVVLGDNQRPEEDGLLLSDTEDSPIIIKEELYAPLRSFGESFGGKIEWDGSTKIASLILNKGNILNFISEAYEAEKLRE